MSKKPAPPPPRPDAELRALALQLTAGNVFTTRHVPPNLWGLVFMPLALMTRAQLRRTLTPDAVVYAVIGEHKHIPGRAINGWPMFVSFAVLSADEYARVTQYADELTAWETSS